MSIKHYTPTVETFQAPKIDLPKQDSFRLLKPGTGTPAELRYQLATATVEFRAETKLASRQLDKGPAIELAPIRDGFAISHAPARAGILEIRPLVAELGAAKTDLGKQAAEHYLAAWRERLQNRRTTVAVDNRGQLGKIAFNDDPADTRSAAAKDELAQRLLGTIVPLPVEPVGPGAVWEVITVLRQGPLFVRQTATYTLAAYTPTSWKIHVKLLRVAEEQTVVDPSLPKGATADLIALFRLLEGDVVIDPSRPHIASGTLTIESRLHTRLKLPGQAATEQFFEDLGSVTFSSPPSR